MGMAQKDSLLKFGWFLDLKNSRFHILNLEVWILKRILKVI